MSEKERMMMSEKLIVEREWLEKVIRYAEFDLLVDDDISAMGGEIATIDRLIANDKIKPAPASALFAEALLDDIKTYIDHYLNPRANEYVPNGRSFAQNLKNCIDRHELAAAKEGE